MTKVVYGNATPRDLKALQSTAEKIPSLRQLMEPAKSQYLREIYENLDSLEDVASLLQKAICDDPPVTVKTVVSSKRDIMLNWMSCEIWWGIQRNILQKLKRGKRKKQEYAP